MSPMATFAIAVVTFKGFARDKIFYGVLVLAFLLISFSYLIASLTFVEQRKILLDFGFSALSFSGIAGAIFIGVSAVAREIENRTIYSVLTKPISRLEYILGKFLGCALLLVTMHVLISCLLVGVLFATHNDLPAGLAACFFLMTLESLTVLSVAVLFSVITTPFLSGCFSFAFFLIGRSSVSLQILAAKAEAGTTKAIFRFLYWLAPNLERYNIREVVAYGKSFPGQMVPWGALYCLLYVALALAASSMIFKSRDLP